MLFYEQAVYEKGCKKNKKFYLYLEFRYAYLHFNVEARQSFFARFEKKTLSCSMTKNKKACLFRLKNGDDNRLVCIMKWSDVQSTYPPNPREIIIYRLPRLFISYLKPYNCLKKKIDFGI